MTLIWAAVSLLGHTPDDQSAGTRHLIDPDQLGTSQEALCETAPRVGSLWIRTKGGPVCMRCMGAMRKNNAVRTR